MGSEGRRPEGAPLWGAKVRSLISGEPETLLCSGGSRNYFPDEMPFTGFVPGDAIRERIPRWFLTPQLTWHLPGVFPELPPTEAIFASDYSSGRSGQPGFDKKLRSSAAIRPFQTRTDPDMPFPLPKITGGYSVTAGDRQAKRAGGRLRHGGKWGPAGSSRHSGKIGQIYQQPRNIFQEILFLSDREHQVRKAYANKIMREMPGSCSCDTRIRQELVPAFHFSIATFLAAHGAGEEEAT